jgi:hypothetical protein
MALIDSFLPRKTDWRFAGSAGGGVCVETPIVNVSVCAGGGKWYLKNPAGTEVSLDHIELEAGIALSLAWVVSVFGSAKSFPSGGIGHLYKGPNVEGDLTIDHLSEGMVACLTFSKGTIGASADLTVVLLGVPWLTLAPTPLAASLFLMSNALGVMWGVNARTEIQVAGVSASRGLIV